jgi:hypothetical protein
MLGFSGKVCIIFSRCRTGSTTLVRSIGEHEHAVAFSEILNSDQPHSYQSYLVNLLRTDPDAGMSFVNHGPLFALERYLNSLITQGDSKKPNIRWAIFECKIENLYCLSDRWSHPGAGFNNVAALNRLIDCADGVVFLRRRNAWLRYCSDVSSQLTGILHSDQGDATGIPIGKIHTDIGEMIRNLIKEVEFDQRFYDYLRVRSSLVTLADYEDMFLDGQFSNSFCRQFFAATGGVTLEKTTLGQLHRPAGPDLFENYSEILLALKSVPSLSWMVDTP